MTKDDTPKKSGFRHVLEGDWKAEPMSTPASTYGRAKDRATGLTFRMSPDDKADLNQRAANEGFASVQTYLEYLVWGRRPSIRKSGPSPQKELPLTG